MSRKADQGRFVRNLVLSLTVGIVVQLVSGYFQGFSLCDVPDNALRLPSADCNEYVEEVFCRRYRMSMVLTRIELDSL